MMWVVLFVVASAKYYVLHFSYAREKNPHEKMLKKIAITHKMLCLKIIIKMHIKSLSFMKKKISTFFLDLRHLDWFIWIQ